jgi:hypothetical protein
MLSGLKSNKVGRRPAYIICFNVFVIANLGLALQNNYAGSSGTVVLANGALEI